MPIDRKGYLGDDIAAYEKRIAEEFKEEVALYRELNEFGQTLQSHFTGRPLPNNYGPRHLTLLALFIKALNSYQAILIVLLKGLETDGKVLTRSLLDGLINFAFCSVSEDNYNRFICDSCRRDLEQLDWAEKNPEEWPDEMRDPDYREKERKKLKEVLDAHGNLKKISIVSKAKDAGGINLFNSVYGTLSFVSHSDPRSLDPYVRVAEDGVITLVADPEVMDLHTYDFLPSMSFMLRIMNVLREFFDLAPSKELEDIKERLDRLSRQE